MRRAAKLTSAFVALLALAACASTGPNGRRPLTDEIDHAIGRARNASVSIAFADLATHIVLLREETQRYPAAGTTKLPILLTVYDAIDHRDLLPDQQIPIRNRFKSLMDGSDYALNPKDDDDPELYASIGGSRPVSDLARRMIVRDSNLAANLLLDKLGASRVMDFVRLLGSEDTQVLRGAEDALAFKARMNNSTTAKDLLAMLRGLEASSRGVPPPGGASQASARAMIEILKAQPRNEKILAGLPPGTPVAHKSGDAVGVHHDAAIVYPPGRPPYILVVLTSGFLDEAVANRTLAAVSRAVWESLQAR